MPSQRTTPPPIDWDRPTAVQVHVALADVAPPVWRRLVVPLKTTLSELHHILQAAMGWSDRHLHEFNIAGVTYGDRDLLCGEGGDEERHVRDASKVRLRALSRKPGVVFEYNYDFGDGWRHTVTLERLLVLNPAPQTAVCMEGARCCPPEDCGGPERYFEFLRVLLAPEANEIGEQRRLAQWSGGGFDPLHFDLLATDIAVREALPAAVRRGAGAPRVNPAPRRAPRSRRARR